MGIERCQGLHVKIYHFSPSVLNIALNEERDNTLLRQIYLDIHCTHLNAVTTIGEALDAYLAPRPWWMVSRQAVSDSHKLNHTSVHSSTIHAVYHVLLLRHFVLLEPMFRKVAEVQYPPVQICEQTSLRGKI